MAVAAASLASPPPIQPRVKKPNEMTRTTAPAPAWERTSIGAIPLISATAKKPPTSMIDTRLEIVMVRRSVEAANAIRVGNNINLTVSMTMISPIKRKPATARPVGAGQSSALVVADRLASCTAARPKRKGSGERPEPSDKFAQTLLLQSGLDAAESRVQLGAEALH